MFWGVGFGGRGLETGLVVLDVNLAARVLGFELLEEGFELGVHVSRAAMGGRRLEEAEHAAGGGVKRSIRGVVCTALDLLAHHLGWG